MTRPISQYDEAMQLLREGFAEAEVARRMAIPRSTIRTWIERGPARSAAGAGDCNEVPCPHVSRVCSEPAYAYLLGLYLGDGYIATHPRGVYRLRITLDLRYPGIISECQQAMALVYPSRVGLVKQVGCVEVTSYSKHWPCLFPQHGKGLKHSRPILLLEWQRRAAIIEHPRLFLRGLVHSDGSRGTNVVRTRSGVYAYPRYYFSNRSEDVKGLFREACEQVGVHARRMNRWTLTVARHEEIAILDQFIGPKL